MVTVWLVIPSAIVADGPVAVNDALMLVFTGVVAGFAPPGTPLD